MAQFESKFWKINSLQQIRKKGFNSLSQTTKGLILCVIIFEKKASSLRVIKKKSPILWIKFQKHKFQVFASGTILWVIWKINSLRNFSKKSLNHLKTWITCKKKKCSIRWVVLKKKKKVRFFDFESYLSDKNSNSLNHFQKEVQFFESHLKKRFNSLSHFEKKGQFFESDLQKKVQFFESYSKKKKVPRSKKKQFFELHSKKVQFFESEKEKFNSYWEEVHKRGSIQWVIYKEFNSLSHCWNKQKGSILWVIFWDGIIFKKFKKKFGLNQKKKAQFFESNGWKKSSILWVQCKKGSTLSVKFKKVFNTLSHFLWKILLFESNWSKKKEFNSSHVKK